MRLQDWAFFASAAAAIGFWIALMRGTLVLAIAWALVALASITMSRVWSRRLAAPMPTSMRWVLYLVPHGRQFLKKILQPRCGEHLLEIGPGVGHHALAIAPALTPHGVLHVLDIQEQMLAALRRRARAANVLNIVALRGDAQTLPYNDHVFDAAYLVAVLGEIPDRVAVLSELHRILKEGGRLVVGEIVIDPDYVRSSHLRDQAHAAGFDIEETLNLGIAYFMRFRVSQDAFSCSSRPARQESRGCRPWSQDSHVCQASIHSLSNCRPSRAVPSRGRMQVC